MGRAPETSGPGLKGVAAGAQAHDALLRDLFRGIIPLLARPDVPLFIKVFVAGFIFLGIYTSASLVILLADVATSFASRRIDIRTYLGFLGGTLVVLLLMVSIGAGTAQRFENEKTLEANMHAVTRARRQRLNAVTNVRGK
jgi:hypothetical protein